MLAIEKSQSGFEVRLDFHMKGSVEEVCSCARKRMKRI